jgi:hypothetical protein
VIARLVATFVLVLVLMQAERMLTRGAVGSAGHPAPIARSAGLTFAPEVSAGDREWILAAIASARPEARQLIDQVDGSVLIHTHTGSPLGGPGSVAIGTAQTGPDGSVVTFWVDPLDGRRLNDRAQVVLHELGHIVDHVLVDDPLAAELDAGIPVRGVCGPTADGPVGACTAPEERFADTFAKWALRGAVSDVGSGYAIPAPASLEDWGAPLARLAARPSP